MASVVVPMVIEFFTTEKNKFILLLKLYSCTW